MRMRRLSVSLLVLLLLVTVAACGSDTNARTATSTPAVPAPSSTAAATPAPRRRAHHHVRRLAATRSRGPAGLRYSAANNDVVQRQPPPGACHAIGSGTFARPDPSCTPGALNPAVTQKTIHETICVEGWTDTVRPPESITEPEKAASMAAYDEMGPMDAYEYDHFVPLELGGATNDLRNLWPEPGASPNPKDAVEYELRQEVCDRQISLAQAQLEVVRNWTALAARPTATEHAPSTGGGTGRCTVTAAYNSTYRDYDVYVHSNQPDKTVTVTDTAGYAKTWHTDRSGYADVYFHAHSGASGRSLTVRVGTAACHGTL